MKKGMYSVGFDIDESIKEVGSILGIIIDLLANSSRPDRLSAQYINTILKPAIRHKSYKVFCNRRGQPVGFVIWALLDRYTEDLILDTGNFELHESEWNEGPNLWILDFVNTYGNTLSILRWSRLHLAGSYQYARYPKCKGGNIIVKEALINPALTR